MSPTLIIGARTDTGILATRHNRVPSAAKYLQSVAQ